MTVAEFPNLIFSRIGLVYLRYIFNDSRAIISMALSATAIYIIAICVRGPAMPWAATSVLMCHLSILHLDRMFSDHQGGYFLCVNVTQTQMMLVIKLSTLCWNLYDGTLSGETLSAFRRDSSIKKVPSILEYGAFVLFFPNLLTEGCNYTQYQHWIDGSMFHGNHSRENDSGNRGATEKTSIPNSLIPAVSKAVVGLSYTILFINISIRYPVSALLTREHAQYCLAHRIWILHITAFWCRARSYALWAFAEGAAIMCGMGYSDCNPITKRHRWDRMRNVNPFKVELAQNPKAYVDNWNISTNVWLRNYVYNRVNPTGKKPGLRCTLLTFVFSALWHGFYPGYYMSLIFVGLLSIVAKGKLHVGLSLLSLIFASRSARMEQLLG